MVGVCLPAYTRPAAGVLLYRQRNAIYEPFARLNEKFVQVWQGFLLSLWGENGDNCDPLKSRPPQTVCCRSPDYRLYRVYREHNHPQGTFLDSKNDLLSASVRKKYIPVWYSETFPIAFVFCLKSSFVYKYILNPTDNFGLQGCKSKYKNTVTRCPVRFLNQGIHITVYFCVIQLSPK